MSTSLIHPPAMAFLPFPDMEEYLIDELRQRLHYTGNITRIGNLLCIDDKIDAPAPYWAADAMLCPAAAQFASIGEAAAILRGIQRSWASAPHTLFRRTALIQSKLPYVNTKPRTFPADVPSLPSTPMGLFALLDEHTMLYSAQTSSPLPCGRLSFIEDHINPPSRAYTKLQEALAAAAMRLGAPLPQSGSRCLDAGASPGGWTWVLSQLGSEVLAVDRSPLAPSLMEMPHVTFRAHDAFTIPPREASKWFMSMHLADGRGDGCDWVCSDVACYPERLLAWVRGWIDSTLAANMICTIKMQGEADYSIIHEFETFPNSIVLHLNANKHELTFLHRRDM